MLAFYDEQMRCVARAVSPAVVFDVLSLNNMLRAKKVEDAIRYFCSAKSWPANLEDDVMFELYLRLACARWYCDLPVFETVSDEAGEIGFEIEESLINYWNDVGREDFLHDVIEKY